MRSDLRHTALVFAVIFALLTSTFAQTAPRQQGERVYNSEQNGAAARVTQAPVISYADERFAVINWSTDVASEGRVYYGTDLNSLSQVAEDANSTTSHRVHISNLQPGTTYYFQIDTGAQDLTTLSFNTPAAGGAPLRDYRPLQASMPANRTNAQQNQAGGWSQNAVITRGPTIQYADDRSAVVTWTTNVPIASKLYYGTQASNLAETAEGDGNTTNHRVYLSGLSPATTYYFDIDLGGAQPGRLMQLQTVAAGARPVYDRAAVQANAPASGEQPRLARRDEEQQQGQWAGGEIVPAGTEVQAKLETALSSKTSKQGDQFTALVMQPVMSQNGRVAIPAGSRIRGEVSGVEQGKTGAVLGRAKARLNLTFRDVMLPNGASVPITATLMTVNQGKKSGTDEEGQVTDKTTGKEAATKIGIGAGIGTIAGLIFGSALKGLAIGAIAGGGYVLATQGKDVEIPAESGIVLQLDRYATVPPPGAVNQNQNTNR